MSAERRGGPIGIYAEGGNAPFGVCFPDADSPKLIGPVTSGFRKVEDAVLSWLFPHERVPTGFDGLSEDPESLRNFARLERLVGEEDYSAWLMGAHLWQSDPIVGILASNQSRVLRQRKYVAPIARHHLKPGVRFVGGLAGVELYPIVTGNTIKTEQRKAEERAQSKWPFLRLLNTIKTEQRKAEERAQSKWPFLRLLNKFLQYPLSELGEGEREFMGRALEAFAENGVLYVNPQGEREPKLNVPKKKTAATLAVAAIKHNLTKIAIVPVGFEIEGVEDYSTVNKYNLRKRVLARFGPVFTLEEALAELGYKPDAKRKMPEIRRVMDLFDAWVMQKIMLVSPAAQIPAEMVSPYLFK